ncbi:dihydroneopterin aldolase [Caulobacter sp. Root342]|uniref:dihydroneopterin aldolase n=1 Tax=Caulobacter sp. Root342 TaxID=1736519 RepID=UPI000A7BB539|nr:dihydroneopterin aldolase [Caulobacter sp. Root342]
MAAAPLVETAAASLAPQDLARIIVTKVFVRGLKVDAQIGVYDHEHGRVQPLIVDVELDVAASHCERLGDTVNYEMVGEAARAIVAEGHIDLVETFAERLAQACFVDPRVTRARVRVEKPLALAPHAAAAGVEITAVRS